MRQNSASKRNRGQTKAVLKPERKKFNIHVPEGENIANFDADPGMESMYLNSSKGKHITASFDQNVGEAFEKQDNLSKIDDHTVTNVQSSSKNSKASGHVSEMLMKECCFSKKYINRRIIELQSTHKKLVSDHFILKYQFQNFCTDFSKTIADGIEDVAARFDVKSQLEYAARQPVKRSQAINLAESGSKTEVFEVEVQPLDEGYRKKQKISSRIKDCNEEPDKQTRSETSLYLEDDDIIFSEEDLRHMDESAEKNCVQFQKLSSQFAEYIFEGKIEEMPKRFDTKAARHNMAVQLYKYANEKPELQLDL
ncbi:Uncharacterized protein Fot_21546 [Forsythia ovata]|uniref:Uncharacterized protein n=1 Tax=Forsythia ovata TaxID=205694 RepID=A0ABD1UV53_9LAMI